jgi:hypothetical protein
MALFVSVSCFLALRHGASSVKICLRFTLEGVILNLKRFAFQCSKGFAKGESLTTFQRSTGWKLIIRSCFSSSSVDDFGADEIVSQP